MSTTGFVLDTATNKQRVFVKSYVLTHAKGLMPSTTLSVEVDGKTYKQCYAVTIKEGNVTAVYQLTCSVTSILVIPTEDSEIHATS